MLVVDDEPLWLRYPAISPDAAHVVFTYKGDLYRVPASGGSATQLTAHAAHDYMPVWSRDGAEIFYLSGNALVRVPVSTEGAFTLGVSNTTPMLVSPLPRGMNQTQ